MSAKSVKVPKAIIEFVKKSQDSRNTTYVNSSYEKRSHYVFNLFISPANVNYVARIVNPNLNTNDVNNTKYRMLNWYKNTLDSEYLTASVIESLHELNSEFIESSIEIDDSECEVRKASFQEVTNGDFNGLYNRNNSSISIGTPQDNASDNIIPSEIYQHIDAWRDESVVRDASVYRDRNRIPFYQITMNHRPYERDVSDTLKSFGERFTHNRGFNMAQLETPSMDKMLNRKPATNELHLSSNQGKYYSSRYTQQYSATSVAKPYPIGDIYIPTTHSDFSL